jgi:Cu2+-exporting ATPase
MAQAADFRHFVRLHEGGLCELELAIEAMGRAVSLEAVERAVRALPGVVFARLNLSSLRLTVRWREQDLSVEAILDALPEIGCSAHPMAGEGPEDEEARQAKWLLACLAVAGFAAMNIMLLSVSVWAGNVTDITPETRDFFHWLSGLIALPAAAYAGQPFFRSAIASLRARSMTMDVPISVGILLALGMSVVETAGHAEHAYFDSAAMLLFFLLCGRYLDLAMRRRTRSVAANLAALRAEVAQRLDEAGEPVAVPVAAIRPGDRVLVKPGERIPVDGIVLSGRSEIDEGLVTGETQRRVVGPGAEVHCGALSHEGALTVRVNAAGEQTLLADIERLLDKATLGRSRYVRLADRAARLYSPVVHVTALATALVWLAAGASLHDALVVAISVLIITCPCALALAVPAVQVVAAGALFRSGVLLNAPDAIERLAEVDTVILDKTGTLTLPAGAVANAGEVEPEMLALAARLASTSHHPLAAAFTGMGPKGELVPGARETTGQGVSAEIDGVPARLGTAEFCSAEVEAAAARRLDPQASLIAFAYGDRRVVFRVRQALREDAPETVARLAEAGLDVRVLSGDLEAPVQQAADALGLARWQASCKPAGKIAEVEALQREGRSVLMVGDGINDAPALAAARASLSPISASAIAQSKADAVFLGDKLAPVAAAVEIARSARHLMMQNLWLAVLYNAIAVPLAVAGLVTPLVAATAMSGSSMLVTLNALRARSAPNKVRA